MKLFLSIILLFISVNAKTTLCYKKQYAQLSNIESQPFKGGECKNQYSIEDLKSKHWEIKDIKITSNKDNTFDFIYILSKNEPSKQFSNNQEIDYEVIAKKAMQYQIKKKKESTQKSAKNIYIKQCQSCHGVRGEEEAFGTSRALNTLSKNEFLTMMLEYKSGDLDNGNAMFMRPNAAFTTDEFNKYIYEYIQTVK